ncbi:MAG: hypothetical protein AB8H86_17220 [Polyangiales bacterium]
MTFPRAVLCLSFALVVGCGDDDSSADAGAPLDAGSTDTSAPDAVSADGAVAMDAAAQDAGARDAGTDATAPDAASDAGGPDAGEPDVGAPDVGAPDVGVDSGSSCDTRIEDRIAGVCDGIGMQICNMWASENGGGTAVAQCVPADGRCARASTCSGERCMCGSEEECGDTEMCISGFAGFSCVCALPR